MSRPINIFLVEDSASIRRLLVRRLDGLPGLRVVGEACGERQALALIAWTRPDVVLVDLSLSNGSGLSLMAGLRRAGFAGRVAVLTAHDADAYRSVCLDAGADAFYDKASGLETLIDDLGRMLPHQDPPHAVAAQSLLRDGLTALYDEPALCERLGQAARAADAAGVDLALLVLRLEGLRTLAPALAAELADQAAARLQAGCEGAELLNRCPGARFCVLLSGVDAVEQAAACAQRLGQLMREPFRVDGCSHVLRLEMGMALFPADAVSPRGLLTLAEASAFGAL